MGDMCMVLGRPKLEKHPPCGATQDIGLHNPEAKSHHLRTWIWEQGLPFWGGEQRASRPHPSIEEKLVLFVSLCELKKKKKAKM